LNAARAEGIIPAMQPTVIPIPLGFVFAFLVRGKKDILVDAGTVGAHNRIISALQSLGVDVASLSLVLITHGHMDHFGCLAGLLPHLKCPVAVHTLDAEALRRGRSPSGPPVGTFARILLKATAPLVARPSAPVEPGIAFSGSLDLRPYGIEGSAEHTPGHTRGSVSLILSGGEAIIADLLRGSMRAASTPRWPYVAQDLAELKRSIGRVLDQRPRKLWTSHGGPLTADAVRAFLKNQS
jgi:hydroxyacylglutathione hydrolase